MNTLRKLEAGWRESAKPKLGAERDDWDVGCSSALEHCAGHLSVEIPKWERLVVTANDAADWLNFLVRNDNGAALKALQELRTALSEVRHD